MVFNEALKCAKAKLWPQLRSQAKLGNEKMVGGAHPTGSGRVPAIFGFC
jgi:hypothetical protein